MRPFLTFALAKARFFTEFSPLFATFVGVGPLPTGTQFLRDETDAITISKAAGEVTPEHQTPCRVVNRPSGFVSSYLIHPLGDKCIVTYCT